MTDQPESTTTNQPNEYGFGGDPAAPEPQPDREPAAEVDGESIAVPAGDLTAAITHAIEGATRDEDEGS